MINIATEESFWAAINMALTFPMPSVLLVGI
jgi:hypothetical protein